MMFHLGNAASNACGRSNSAQGFLKFIAARRPIGLARGFAMDVANDDALQFTGQLSRGVAQPGSAPALGAQIPGLNALLILTTSRKNNNLGSLFFAHNRSPRAAIQGVQTQF